MRQNELERIRFSENNDCIEQLDAFQMAAEDIMLGMRMVAGVFPMKKEVEIATLFTGRFTRNLATIKK